MKTIQLLILLFIISVNSYGQELSSDFKKITVNKKIKEFPDQFDLSSPLKSCITINYIFINGKERLLRKASTIMNKEFCPDSTVSDSKVSEDKKNQYMNTTIKEIIIYKDSIACVISEIRESYFSLRDFTLENGKWVNLCEDARNSLLESRKYFAKNANQFLHALPLFNSIATIPTDTISFINYLKEKGDNPKEFILDKLKKYKLVMYGDIHRRKASWDFLQKVVNDKKFASNTGIIFMEMASDKQQDIDRFLANEKTDKELLLNIFRDYMDIGWNDKGMFDFVVKIHELNKKLPANNRIRIIAADTPRPFNSFLTKEDMINSDAKYDRNEFMASTILNYLATKKDKRNALFIVGTAHVCKTIESAGSILTKEMSNNLYTVFTHYLSEDTGKNNKRIRHGMFDYAFYKSGDQPIAFELRNSPFGKEPFDGLYPIGFGTYQDNYDGYIFFGSLDKEPNYECLVDLYSDKFILEMDRRFHLEGSSLKEYWKLKELSKKAVLEKVLKDRNKTRWENIIKPLQDGKVVQ